MEDFHIAILLTSYNAKAFIRQTLESISAQTRPPDQVLAADDGSTDGTLEIIEQWAARQPFEVIIRPKSQGPTGSPARGRQWGLERTSANLAALLDHDDLFLPHALERAEQGFLLQPDLVLCFGDARVFQSDPAIGTSLLADRDLGDTTFAERSGLYLLSDEPFLRILKGSFIPTSSNPWRTDAALAAGGFDTGVGSADDALLWMRLCKRGAVGCYREFLSCRRVHANNLSKNDLGSGLSAYRYFRQLIREADALGLSGAERDAISETIRESLPAIAYHAAQAGFPTYWRLKNEVGFPIELKRLLVSLTVSAWSMPNRREDRSALRNDGRRRLTNVPARGFY